MNLAIGHARNATLPLLLAATLSTGCATTFIKQVPNTPESAATPTLLSGYTVTKVVQSDGETNLLDSVVDATQNAQLEEFGQKAYAKLAEQMAERGFVLELEATRARSLDVIQVDGGAALAAATGYWKHPETSSWGANRVAGVLSELDRKSASEKLYEEGKQKYFAFVDISISDRGSWLVMKSPEIRVQSAVVSADGKLVMHSQGVGMGKGAFFFADRSPTNLLLAMEEAFAAMKKVEVEELK